MAGVVFCSIYQLAFTLVCLVYDGRREHEQKHCITFQIIKPSNGSQSPVYRFFCTTGVKKAEKAGAEKGLHESDIELPGLNRFMGNYFAPFLMKIPVKLCAILIYFAYLGVSIYGIMQMKKGLDRKNLVPDTSYYVDFARDHYSHFDSKYGPVVMFVYDEPLNYSDPLVRKEIMYNQEIFRRNKYFCDEQYSVTYWLDILEYYLSMTFRDIDSMDEAKLIKVLRNEFLTRDVFSLFECDIKFDENYTQIVSSRMFLQGRGLKDAEEEREFMEQAREIALDSKFNAYVYHMVFPYYDQYTLVLKTTVQSPLVATVSMLVVALILIPNISTVIWVTITMISIEIGILGFMAFWDIHLESVSMINLIMCIGFSVDFAAHISYHYATSQFLSPQACAKEALEHLGAPIIQAAVSTILGVVILSISTSYIFLTFFKVVTLVMIFGCFHGLFLLPVILSTVRSCGEKPRASHSESQNGNAVVLTPVHKSNGFEKTDEEQEVPLTSQA